MTIALVQVNAAIRQAFDRSHVTVVEWSSLDIRTQSDVPDLEAMVLGADVATPIQGAALAYRLDPSLSVVILCEPSEEKRIGAALRFAPLIARDITIHGAAEADAIVNVSAAAAARTQLRRRHLALATRASAKLNVQAAASPTPMQDRYAAQIMALAPVGVIATDPDFRIVSTNAEATSILRLSERDMLGSKLADIFREAPQEAWSELRHQSEEERRLTRVIQWHGIEGTRTLEARASSVHRSSSELGYLLIFQDITERVELEQQRAHALSEAQAANRLKDEFLATVSHELRTPLNAILGWARLLRTGMASDRSAKALEIIERNTLAQVQLVEDLLDITRITTGKLRLEIEQVQLTVVINAVVETLRPSFDAKQIRLSIDLDPAAATVMGDFGRLQQVVWNLLSNAVKFSPKAGGFIEIALERIGSHVAIRVADNGQGIEPGFLPHIFGSFRQADGSSTRRHGGLGLGLAISKHLVELHGGTIEAQSQGTGRGAALTVRLPLAPIRVTGASAVNAGEQPFALERHPTPPELLGLRVLILEDEADSRELIKSVIESYGASVRSSADVVSAFSEVDSFRPDVIVSDIGMPGQDGYAFITQLRARSRNEGGATPAAALTAYARAEDRRRALDAGFQLHLVKPIDPDELVTVLITLARMAKLIQ